MSEARNFRPDLQGLRAVAVMLVLFSHAGIELLEGGFIGVDIFFVLSGYLITGLLINEYRQTQRISFVDFYIRRIKRLLPSLFFVIFITFILASFLLSSFEFIAKTRAGLYTLSWISNIYFAYAELGYFAEMEQQDLFLHTWSLGVEEQFYLLWPALILGALGLGRMIRAEQKTILTLTLVLAFAGSFWLCIYWSKNEPLWAFYLMPSRIWQFSSGALVYFLSMSLNSTTHSRVIASLAQVGSLVVILISAMLITASMTYPGWAALAPSLATVVILAFPVTRFPSSLLNWRVLIYIGDRSYALYLWHWPVFSLAKSMGINIFWYQQIGLMLISLLLAIFSYRFIEIPFWKGRFSRVSNARTGVVVLIVFLAMVATILNLSSFHRSASKSAETAIIVESAKDIPIIYSLGCDSWYASAEVSPCVFKGENPARTVVLFGDSALGQWFSLFAAVYPPPEWQIIVLTKSACPIVDEDFYYDRIGAVYDVCRTWRDEALVQIRGLSPDVVVIGNAAGYKFTQDQWIGGSSRIFDQLIQDASKIFVLVGTPKLGRNGPACLLKNASSIDHMRANCQSVDALEESSRVASYLTLASEKNASVKVLNFNDLVCPDEVCFAMTVEGGVVFRDSQHLTDSFAVSLLREILRKYPELNTGQ